VDGDPQASLSRTFGQTDPADRFYASLTQRAGLLVKQVADWFTITPSTLELSRAETELIKEIGREHILRVAIDKTELSNDTVVLLDCPPSLGILAVNCLCAAGGLIVVIQPGGFELHAVVHLGMTVRVIQQQANCELAVLGTILTNCHPRRKITGQIEEELSRIHPVLGAVRTDAQLLYATTAGTLLKLKRSNALSDYQRIVDRLWTVLA